GESLVVSLSGGVAGIALAWLAGSLVDARARAGQQLFFFSGRLLGFAVVFAAVLGAIAGAYATARILRVPPAEAMRRGGWWTRGGASWSAAAGTPRGAGRWRPASGGRACWCWRRRRSPSAAATPSSPPAASASPTTGSTTCAATCWSTSPTRRRP